MIRKIRENKEKKVKASLEVIRTLNEETFEMKENNEGQIFKIKTFQSYGSVLPSSSFWCYLGLVGFGSLIKNWIYSYQIHCRKLFLE